MNLWQGDPFADLWAVVAKPPKEEICHQCPTSVGLPASSHLALLFGHRWHNNTDYKHVVSLFHTAGQYWMLQYMYINL